MPLLQHPFNFVDVGERRNHSNEMEHSPPHGSTPPTPLSRDVYIPASLRIFADFQVSSENQLPWPMDAANDRLFSLFSLHWRSHWHAIPRKEGQRDA
jgi:hypothetical protein